MVTINVKAMLSQMTLTDESIGVFVANCFQGLITIDDFDQLNEKSVEGLYRVLRRPVGTTGGCPILGLKFQRWLRRT